MKKVLDTYSSKNDINIKQIVAYKDNILEIEEYKVIDVAMKYGYDSPDSFTKAFTRFHGITPCLLYTSPSPRD